MIPGRNYQIPDGTIGFYGTGLKGLDDKDSQKVSNILTPVAPFFESKIEIKPIHITCRYLGYFDETNYSQIETLHPHLINLYSKHLPLKVNLKKLVGTWQLNPGNQKKYLMLEIDSPELSKVHEEIVKITPDFPVFSGAEGKSYKAHITLGKLKEGSEENIPSEVIKYVESFSIDSTITFSEAYLWRKDDVINL